MKNFILPALFVSLCFLFGCNAQKGITLSDIWESSTIPSEQEATTGLKQALQQGIDRAVGNLAKPDGFSGNEAYKIFLPPETQKMESTLRSMGLGNQVDRVINTLNDGAEVAVGEAKEVFIHSIKQMTVRDALEIVKGSDDAATEYLKRTTSEELRSRFQPKIQEALNQVGATKYWTDIASTYNKIPLVTPVEADLNRYVTEQALSAIFDQVRLEEARIRKDPVARGTEILRKVFGYADLQN